MGREGGESFGDTEKQRRGVGGEGDWSGLCWAKELRVWGAAEGTEQRELGGKSGPELKEALPQMALQQPSLACPGVNLGTSSPKGWWMRPVAPSGLAGAVQKLPGVFVVHVSQAVGVQWCWLLAV